MDTTQPCVACREPIRVGASLCRYCGTSQNNNPWNIISIALKWSVGLIAVISLVIGMITLTYHYRDLQQQRVALADLAQAADWLTQARDYAQAWNIYKEALELEPASTDARRGQYQLAKVWLRDLRSKKDEMNALLGEISHILYRGIGSGGEEETAIALAHAGWVQVLRRENSLPVRLDVDRLFEQALAENPTDVFANAMYGYWMLIDPGVSLEQLKQAQFRFASALETDKARPFVRRLQLGSLEKQAFGRSNEVEREAHAALLQATASMMENAEPKPAENLRYRILSAYGTVGRGENVETSLDVLPVAKHLAVVDWLMDGLTYAAETGRARNLAQLHYVRTRLREAMGESQQALQQYRALLSADNSSTELDGLIDKAIERLSGNPPVRVMVRNYRNDPVDTSDPWSFYLQTITHFDPKSQPENVTQALNFFDYQIGQSSRRLPDLLEVLPEALERIRQVVRERDEIPRQNDHSLVTIASDHENALINLLRLGLVFEKALLVTADYDGAIAVLSDLERLGDIQDDRWAPEGLRVTYELARIHALRAGESGDTQDVEKSLSYLQSMVQQGGVDGEIASWDEIKGEDFKSIWNDSNYREMTRGR